MSFFYCKPFAIALVLLIPYFAQASDANLPIPANPMISALPGTFTTGLKTTPEIHAQYPMRYERIKRDLDNLLMQHFEEERRSVMVIGGGVNGTQEFRVGSLQSAITGKFIPGFHDLLYAADRLGVDPVFLLLSVMTENTLATNNKSKKVVGYDTGLSNNDLKDIDHGLASIVNNVSGGYRAYSDKVSRCDSGEHFPLKDSNQFLKEIGMSGDVQCSSCQKLDYSYRYLCYWAFLGELKMPGFFATSYGPAQLHMESAVSVVDVPNLYGKDGIFGREIPSQRDQIYQDVENRMMTWSGAIAIVAGMLKQGEYKYLEKGWDISHDYPVLVTLYHMGKIGYHVAQAQGPGGTYYPTSDFFGTYSVFLYPLATRLVEMGRDVESGKRQWDLHELKVMTEQIP